MFTPLKSVDEILINYKNYIKTSRFINDSEINELFIKALDEEQLGNGPFLDVTDSFLKGKTLNELIDLNVLSSEYRKLNTEQNKAIYLDRPLYLHQEKAIDLISTNQRSAVITTGTGSGKTESFLYPILNELMKEKEAGTLSPGVRTLIIYPMNALATDQIKRIRSYLKNYPDITYGIYTGETENTQKKAYDVYKEIEGKEPLKNELISREAMKAEPPNIIITNYSMLEYLLLRPDDKTFFEGENSNHWRNIVLDEAHTYYGSLGIEVSMLLSRLRVAIKPLHPIKYILTSATLGDKNSVDKIVDYANNLTNSNAFDHDSILFAERESIEAPENVEMLPEEFYKEIHSKIEDVKEIKNIYKKHFNNDTIYDSISEILFDIVTKDKFYYDVRNTIKENPSINYIIEQHDITDKRLEIFVDIASKAERNGVKPFDSKYHMFIRTLEGCFVKFGPNPEVRLKPVKNDSDGINFYEISVCQYCGQIYLTGNIETGKFVQDKELENPQTYMLTKNIDYLSIKEYEIYHFYTDRGQVVPIKQVTNNEKSTEYYLVKKIKNNGEKISTCISCNAFNNKGLVQSFYFGKRASTSVVASSLYKIIPGKIKNIENKVMKPSIFSQNQKNIVTNKVEYPKQFLVFSDSRQQAAHFASYFEDRHNAILSKKLLLKSLDIAKEEKLINTNNAYKYVDIKNILSNQVKEHMKFYDINENVEIIADKILLYEFVARDRNSLKNLGLIDMYIDFETDDFMELNENLSREENIRIYNYIMKPFIDKHAVTTPVNFSDSDLVDIFRTKNSNGYNFEIDSFKKSKKFLKGMRNLLSENMNEQIFGTETSLEEFLNGFVYHFSNTHNQLEQFNESNYKINRFKIIIRDKRNAEIFQCDTCRKTQHYKMNNICIHCLNEGLTKKESPMSISENIHYSNIYSDNYLEGLIIKEHTAQIDPHTAKEYQRNFIDKKINILSCSTTFEMGVDVGDLETVFMRNTPPSPANYVQRAGRAGRSADAAAFILTFCANSSHDLNYFKYPLDMIRGKITPPIFDRNNKKILNRHLNAVVLSEFWRANPESFSKVKNLFDEKTITLLLEFIKENESVLRKKMKSVCPEKSLDYLDVYFEIIKTDESSIMQEYILYKSEIEELENIIDAHINSKNRKYDILEINNVEKARRSLEEERIISYLSRKNVLPKYGFPVDTVELNTNNNLKKLRLTRDLSQAISEYAPGSQVIADGKIYTSRYINLQRNKAIKLEEYALVQCTKASCKHINIALLEKKDNLKTCRLCGSNLNGRLEVMLVPRQGFTAEYESKVAKDLPPISSPRSDVFYVGNSSVEVEEKFLKYGIKIKSSKNDELMLVSKVNFRTCEECGYTVNHEKGVKSHKNKYGYKCDGKVTKDIQLGHIFKTDVLVIELDIVLDITSRIGLLHALLDSISTTLHIERKDISGTTEVFFDKDVQKTNIVLFDNVPGGAGHVKRLFDSKNESLIEEIFRTAKDKLKNCECDEDSSCYHCLRNYQNQKFHDKLSRKEIIKTIESITGEMF
ncbi:DEAD/DEAH box helicase [Macrococcus sp. DPC7161]|uniref:DEAD/DEAH box helicase n=1 Tax=Macrococcus sp. DPC7161 TaxID=2507060 RepID=UPI00100A703A|nr:DEAD/DEAH box helicase [Macrococcus sp. DPC7161]RXK17383.1 DEAD/DEAH box helicase [Macrococcus sp. DPC7161]